MVSLVEGGVGWRVVIRWYRTCGKYPEANDRTSTAREELRTLLATGEVVIG